MEIVQYTARGEKGMSIFQKSKLFKNISETGIHQLLDCLHGNNKTYTKGSFLLQPGSITKYMGVVISGSVDIIEEDFWGNRTILSRVTQGGIFGEGYAACPDTPLLVGAVAAEPCEVLWLNISHIITQCQSNCKNHTQLIKNLLTLLAKKNTMLVEKITHISQRSTRKKLLSYLSAEAKKSGDSTFLIPFNRQQLADYLSVDRSALSAELSNMQQKGFLSYKKNQFTLYRDSSEIE